jgi:D-sedoheptulose 7-phosphate isomerase
MAKVKPGFTKHEKSDRKQTVAPMTPHEHLFTQRLGERQAFWQNLTIPPTLVSFTRELALGLARKGKLFIIGNGGSSCEASHLAAELVNRLYVDRPACAALALNTDMANLTAIANDSDFRYIFSRQLEALARPGDMLLALTTGGSSPNILEAVRHAVSEGLHCSVLCGRKIEKLAALGPDLLITVDSPDTPTIQEVHLFYIHLIAEAIEKGLGAGT